MRSKLGIAIAVAMAIATMATADQQRVTRSNVDRVIASWPAHPRDAARKLIGEYGLPNEATASTLTWFNNGPWKRTVLFRDEIPHDFPKPHTDYLQQFINYRVSPEKFDSVASYDGSVIAERTKGEISARCDKQEMNFLALNLANDVITGKKTIDEARKFYADSAVAFMNGEKRTYTTGLQFPVSNGRAGDTDRTIIPQSILASMPPPPPSPPAATSGSLADLLASWPSHPRDAANTLIAQYGEPNEVTATKLTWFNNGPWKRTIVYRDEIPHNFPKPHTDFVEQFIDYRVPTDKFSDLARYDGSVIAERTKGEISARCDKEEMNLLALNLANDVVNGRKSVDEARQFYADTAVAAMKGEKPTYTTALQISKPVQTADADISIIPQAMTSSTTTTTTEETAAVQSATSRRHRRLRKD